VSVYYERSTTVQESTGASVEVTATAYISFEVDALEAEVYVDGAYEGVVEHFTQRPLEVSAREHHVELRLGGERAAEFKVRPGAGQHVKIRTKLYR
jgi:ferric-dicitrate binding protein FerR (iron transport regulator)